MYFKVAANPLRLLVLDITKVILLPAATTFAAVAVPRAIVLETPTALIPVTFTPFI